MNKRICKKKWNRIYKNRAIKFFWLTKRISNQNRIKQRLAGIDPDSPLSKWLDDIVNEMHDICYDMTPFDERKISYEEFGLFKR